MAATAVPPEPPTTRKGFTLVLALPGEDEDTFRRRIAGTNMMALDDALLILMWQEGKYDRR